MSIRQRRIRLLIWMRLWENKAFELILWDLLKGTEMIINYYILI